MPYKLASFSVTIERKLNKYIPVNDIINMMIRNILPPKDRLYCRLSANKDSWDEIQLEPDQAYQLIESVIA